MRIGVVSDTHSKTLPERMIEDFRHVDLIIHAGDFTDLMVYEALSKVGKVEGVCGNMDGPAICERLPKKRILSCGGRRIGLTHGDGPPKTLADKVRDTFKNEKVDVIVFGHSHHPLNEVIDGVLYFNPGSPTDEIFAPYRSYGLLELTPDKVTGYIVRLDK